MQGEKKKLAAPGGMVPGAVCLCCLKAVIVVVLAPVLLASSAAQRRAAITSTSALEIDIPRIALAHRSAVEKVLGKPDDDSDPSKDFEGYSWGFVAYEKDRLVSIDYSYKTKPRDVKEALEKVGLKLVSHPRKGPLSYFWNSSTGPLMCCGFEFDNIVLLSDFSEISVGIKRKVPATK